MRGAQPARTFRAAHQNGQGAEADGALPGIAALGRQRGCRQSRAVPADSGCGLDRRAARRQAVRKRALVRARERTDRQDAALGSTYAQTKAEGRSALPLFSGLPMMPAMSPRSEEHTSELQSLRHLVCRLLLE